METQSSRMTPQDRAERSAAAMLKDDAASQGIGAKLDAIGPGTATMTMTVRPDMLNGHGICHGGYIFLLADSAFAFACNSYNAVTVAQSNQITYLCPVRLDACLSARAVEVARAGRSGTYDVTVTDETGTKVALFRGLSRIVSGQHFDESGHSE